MEVLSSAVILMEYLLEGRHLYFNSEEKILYLLLFSFVLMYQCLYWEISLKNVPIRHLLNEESLFISRLRFAIKEVKLRYNVSPYGNLIEAWNYTLLHFQLYIPQIFYYIYVFYISNYTLFVLWMLI